MILNQPFRSSASVSPQVDKDYLCCRDWYVSSRVKTPLRLWASTKYLSCGLLSALNHCLCLVQVNVRQSICRKSWFSIRSSSCKIKQCRQTAGMWYVHSHRSYMPECKKKLLLCNGNAASACCCLLSGEKGFVEPRWRRCWY